MSKNSAFKQFQINIRQDFVVSECIPSLSNKWGQQVDPDWYMELSTWKVRSLNQLWTSFSICNNLAVAPV